MTKHKWYAAVKRNSGGINRPYHADIIKDTIEPTAERYPQYAYMFGGYTTKRRALQVAMYQNFIIDTPREVYENM